MVTERCGAPRRRINPPSASRSPGVTSSILAATAESRRREATRARIIASRESLVAALSGLGFEVLPSQANFVFARHPGRSGAALAAGLRERGVLVRHFQKPRIEDFLRITVGTDEQCGRLISVLRELT